MHRQTQVEANQQIYELKQMIAYLDKVKEKDTKLRKSIIELEAIVKMTQSVRSKPMELLKQCEYNRVVLGTVNQDPDCSN